VVVALLAVLAFFWPCGSASAAVSGGARARVINVSAVSGHDQAGCGSRHQRCATITYAVAKALPWSTVLVWPGTYHESVLITKPLTVRGVGNPVVDARGFTNGFAIGNPLPTAEPTHPIPVRAVGTVLTGFTIENAAGEGILALQSGKLTILDNVVVHNDRAAGTPRTIECATQGNEPGDCGEGLHLLSVFDSVVAYNHVVHNVGGILITDEVGPSHGNSVVGNDASYNVTDCGITLPGHNPAAVRMVGKHLVTQPGTAGVYDNHVIGNRVVGNGGAGILFAAPAPGTASYNNVAEGNYIAGNGNPGVTFHMHAPGQDLGGNRIVGNTIGRNNLAGDPDAGVKVTTGIEVFTAAGPFKGVVIADNRIVGNHFGVWLSLHSGLSPRQVAHANRFFHVQRRVFVAPK
jgi:hypothetical protein